MRILVLGGGLQGNACAFDLLEHSDALVAIADAEPRRLPPYLEKHADGRLSQMVLDVRDRKAVLAAMQGHDGALSAVPYYFNYELTELAVEAGIHFADLGGNTEIVQQQETLDAGARAKGISVMPDCGLVPGMVNILAADGIAQLDVVDTVKLFVGGLPLDPEPPLSYKIVYSLEGALDYYTTPSWVLKDGCPTEVEPLSELEQVEFASPPGRLEAFHTAGGLSTMPWEFQGQVRVMEYKTLRYPGHAQVMRAVRDLGLLGVDPVEVKGAIVRPRDVFIAVVDPKLRDPHGKDLVALKVVASGTKAGEPAAVIYRLLDFRDEERGISAMMRATGYSLSIAGLMQVTRRIDVAGVRPAYKTMPAKQYLAELARRGIAVEISTEVRREK